jgi:peptidoglycan/xylan/chitin deacetylase (PgdA/CDA1 family)
MLDALAGGDGQSQDLVAVTFDDGFECMLRNAYPVLQEFNIPSTLFVLSDRLGASNDWMHPRGFPRRSLLSRTDVLELAGGGVTIGSHTCTHPRLTALGPDQQMAELSDSKNRLQDMLGRAVDYFAYPYGDYDDEVRGRVEAAGYRAACSTRAGFNRVDVDRFRLRRLEVYGTDKLWAFRNKIRFGTNEMDRLFPLRYYASRIGDRLNRYSRKG